MPFQPVAALVELNRFIERRLALLEAAHDLFELGQCRLEAQLLNVTQIRCRTFHSSAFGPGALRNQRLNGSLMPGTISSEAISSPRLSASAAASAASASR